jgi:O-antigen/teichoic acid export membrane protein
MDKSNSYNQIAKATGIFGGVQVINILLSIIRSKFVAVLLGTSGLGILGLFTATTNTIASMANLGISFSAVRTISVASGTDNKTLISRTIITLRRWVNFTGIAGALFTLVLAPKLSQWTFGNDSYTWAFVWLSITLFFQEISGGQLALLQGLRKLKQLAKANVMGSFLGLCLSLPFYYWLRLQGIVPALILTAGTSLILSWYFTRKVEVEKVSITLKESFTDGMGMVKLGSVMMVTGFATTGTMYLIRMYINRTGGIEQVGLYTAAGAIVSNYVGMVFTAMSTDYFPRLSAVNDDNLQVKKLVNQQAELAILILGPILILLLSALPFVIRILLTPNFMPIIGLIQWALIGVLFKAASWSIAFIILAKGDSKIFFVSEITANIILLTSNILLYHFFNLDGIGFAFLISYLSYLIVVFVIVRIRYSFSFSTSFIKLFLIQFALTSAASILVWQIGFPKGYFSGAILLLASTFHSYYEAKKRIDIRAILQRIKGK